MLDQLVPVLGLLVDLALAEVDASGLVDELLARAVQLDEEVGVRDRLVVVTETATEEARGVERRRRLLLPGVLRRELLELLGGRVVDDDVLEVAADLVDRLLGQRRVGLGLDQPLAHLHREADQLGALEVDRGVVDHLVPLRVGGVRLGQLLVEHRGLAVLLLRLHLLDLFAGEARLQDEELLLQIVVLLELLGNEEALDALAQLAVVLLDAVAIEQEVRRVDRQLVGLVVLDDVLEQRDRVVEVVGLVVNVRLLPLDLDELGGVRDVLDVRVERLDHLLLVLGDRLLGELDRLLLLAALLLALRALLELGDLFALLDLLLFRVATGVVDRQAVLPRDDRRVRRLLQPLGLRIRIELDDLGVDRRRLAVLRRLARRTEGEEELGVVEGHQVDVLLLREVLEVLLVEVLRERVDVLVLRLLRFLVPHRRELTQRAGGGVAALVDRLLLEVLAVLELVVDRGEALQLLDVVRVRLGAGAGQRVAKDLVLPEAELGRVLEELHQLAEDLDRVVELTLAVVELGERLHHRRGVVAADALEERPRLLRRADARVGADRVLLGFLVERDAPHLGLRAPALLRHLDDVDEGRQRALEVAEVVVDPALLVLGVAEDARVRELQDLVVERERLFELLLLEEVLAEREQCVGDELRLREVLDEALEVLARRILLLHLGQQVGEVEEHLVHALVALVLLPVGDLEVLLDRAEEPLLLALQVVRLLRLHLVGAGLVALLLLGIDLLVEITRPEVVVALLLGKEARHAVEQVRLLRIGVRRRVDEALEHLDLLVGDRLHLLAQAAEDVLDVDRRLLLVVLARLRGLGQRGLVGGDLRLFLGVLGRRVGRERRCCDEGREHSGGNPLLAHYFFSHLLETLKR